MKIATLILSVFILFRPVLPAIEYVVLYDYIKNELCINKDKPAMECNGKCHLKKELAKVAESDSHKDKQRSFSPDNLTLFYQEIPGQLPSFIKLPNNSIAMFFYKDSYHFSWNSSIFRPPLFTAI